MSNDRINVEFFRIIFPNGNGVKIPEFKGVDGTGYYGLRDKYTTHSSKFYGSAFITSLLAAGVSTVGKNSDSTDSRDGRSMGQEAEAGAVANMLNAFQEVIKKNLDTPPTATIREGYQFNILLVEDVELSAYK